MNKYEAQQAELKLEWDMASKQYAVEAQQINSIATQYCYYVCKLEGCHDYIYDAMVEMNPMSDSVQPHLERTGQMFNVYIDFDEKWKEFLGIKGKISVDSSEPFRTNYKHDREGGLAAIALIYYFRYYDPYIVESVNPHRLQLASNTEKEVRSISSSSIFTFGETSKYLDKISQNTLVDLTVMVDQIMCAGRGSTESKKSAKKRFDKYCEERYH